MQCSKVQAQISALVASEYSHRSPSVDLSNPADQSINSASHGYQELSNWQRRRMQRHCRACSDCRKQWEQTQRLWAGMKSVAAEATPDRIRAAFFASLSESAETTSFLSVWHSQSYTGRRQTPWQIVCEAIPVLGTMTVILYDIVTEIPMPQSRFARALFALFVILALSVIGHNAYRRYLDHTLASAIQKKNVSVVKSLLAKGINPNSLLSFEVKTTDNDSKSYRQSALDYSIHHLYPDFVPVAISKSELPGKMPQPGDLDSNAEAIACLLIQYGAEVNPSRQTKKATGVKNAYLQEVCRLGSLPVLRCLLNKGALPDEAVLSEAIKYEEPPSHGSGNITAAEAISNRMEAARHRTVSQQMVQMLREHGAQLAPYQAVALNDMKALKAQLEAGISADQPDSIISFTTQSPLYQAAQNGNVEAVKLLLSRGADPTYHLNQGFFIAGTALTAAIKNMPELVPDLLKRGVDVNSENSEPLRAAITARRIDLVQDLLRYGANVNPVRPFKQTGFPVFSPLAVAVFNAPELEETLHRAGARLDAVDKLNCLATALNESKLKQQYTPMNSSLRPLDISQKENQRKLLLKLLALGVDINGVDGEGETPLTQAVQHMPASVGLLLEHGAKPNVVPRDPRLPLELAAQAGQEENVRLLMAHGADPNARNAHSHTALYWARRHNYATIIALLKQAGATLDQ